MTFASLGLVPSLLRAVEDQGYTVPTSIQLQAIPHVLAGRDVLGCAQTGTGKTAAFALPILQRLAADDRRIPSKTVRVLVLAPTRELAAQIDESFGAYARYIGIGHTVVFGGVGHEKQVRAIKPGIHVLVATPGRLLDLLDQRVVNLNDVEIFVLDEADRMLDMGFIHDVRRILRELPRKRQTLLFSATMPREIRDLADDLLRDPAEVAVTPVASAAHTVTHSVYFVEKSDKRNLLLHLVRDAKVTRALVFTRTKHGANRVTEYLDKSGVISAAIHGNKSQNARERALAGFKSGAVRVLVATDIAARGIDVEAVSHVINFDIPNEPESYVHRIGRTGRAGASGIAWSFCERDERSLLRTIERTIKANVPVVEDHPYRAGSASTSDSMLPPASPMSSRGRDDRRDDRPVGASRGRPSGGGGRGPSSGGRGPGGGGGGGGRSSGGGGARPGTGSAASGRTNGGGGGGRSSSGGGGRSSSGGGGRPGHRGRS